jgi:membrane associated rhomboid family serine protease
MSATDPDRGLGRRRFLKTAALSAGAVATGFAQPVVAQDHTDLTDWFANVSNADGVVGVALGVSFAFGHREPSLVLAHLRSNLLGFLGFTIVGTTYQFYPPAVGTFPGASDRTAFVSIAALAVGLLGQVAGLASQAPAVSLLGQLSAVTGVLLYAYVLVAVFTSR